MLRLMSLAVFFAARDFLLLNNKSKPLIFMPAMNKHSDIGTLELHQARIKVYFNVFN